MGIAAISKHVSLLLVVTLLVLGTCSAHSSKGRANRRGRTNLDGINYCYRRNNYPCHADRYYVTCYNRYQGCNGINECPYYDDEYGCAGVVRPTQTLFRTRTATRMTTSTSTTTSSATVTSTSTVIATVTSTVVSSRKLTAIVPFKATSSSSSTTATVTLEYTALVAVPGTGNYAADEKPCAGLAAVAAGVQMAAVDAYHVNPFTPTITITPMAAVSCMPSSTSYS